MTHDVSFFDARAETWNRDNPVPQEKLRRLMNLCDLSPGQGVLDVGTGTGRLVPLLLEQVGPEGCVCGLDPSEGMLSVARKRHRAPNLRFVLSAAESIPLEDNSFDRVICYAVFPHFQDSAGAVGELVRVLRPSGLLVIAHTEGREAINAMHRSAGSEVARDILPPAADVSQLLQDHQLRVRRSLDSCDFFLVSASKDPE